MTPEQIDRAVILLNTGQFAQAAEFVQAILEAAADDAVALLYRGVTFRVRRQFSEALIDFYEARQRAEATNNRALLADAYFQSGVVHSEMNDWVEAYTAFEASKKLTPPNADRCAAMCEALCRLDRYEEAVEWRNRALEIRNCEAKCRPEHVVPRARPKSFDPAAVNRNIVSYCLFGDDRYYHECAVTVARTTPFIFPEFTTRFYCARDLPLAVTRALSTAGAQVMIAQDGENERISPYAGTFWRFLAFDDPNIDVVLCRDVDSPILPRERAAIDLWLGSDAPFYTLRDNPIHAEPILAGMWGGFTGVLPPLGPMAYRFARSDHSKFADQRFLRQKIWPRIREATLSIDSYDGLGWSVDFPPGFCKHGRMHVGVSWTRQQIFGPRRSKQE